MTAHGPHTLVYWAVDNAGNVGILTRSDFLVNRAPQATNRNPSASAWLSTPPELEWNFTDPDADSGGGLEVQIATEPSFAGVAVESGTVGSTATGWQAPALSDGDYYWRVRVRDALGVWSAWSPPTRLRVDATAPEVNALHDGSAIPSGSILLGGNAIVLNATDARSGVDHIEYSLDGSPWKTYSGPFTLDGPGRHVLVFRAIDVAGNVGAPHVLAVSVAANSVNWTPIIAVIVAILLACAGAIVFYRRRDPNAKPSKKVSWVLFALPGTGFELVIGVASFVTGELATPPWLGAGLLTILAVAVIGVASIALGAKTSSVGSPRGEG